jgi:hypothetical protein
MSMICVLQQTDESEIKRFLTNPDGIADFLYDDKDEETEVVSRPEIDLDKAWHGIHFLLTRSVR